MQNKYAINDSAITVVRYTIYEIRKYKGHILILNIAILLRISFADSQRSLDPTLGTPALMFKPKWARQLIVVLPFASLVPHGHIPEMLFLLYIYCTTHLQTVVSLLQVVFSLNEIL
uniref:Uncharacterized protein n=1 Tax=Anguilla anguilla TaxID=7936 RepID=A0A0E9W8M1_ANGAN